MFELFNQKDQEKELKELEIQNSHLTKETDALFAELGVTPESLKAFFQQSHTLSPTQKKELEEKKAALHEQLKRELENARSVKTAQENFKKLQLPPHALFVR